MHPTQAKVVLKSFLLIGFELRREEVQTSCGFDIVAPASPSQKSLKTTQQIICSDYFLRRLVYCCEYIPIYFGEFRATYVALTAAAAKLDIAKCIMFEAVRHIKVNLSNIICCCSKMLTDV